MNSAFRRTLSFLMAVILCFTMLPVSAFATDVVTELETETVGETTTPQETSAPVTTSATEESSVATESADSEGTTAPEEETEEPTESEETTVSTEPTVTRTLAVQTLPDRTKYQAGDEIDITGLELYLETSDGDSQIITVDDGITVVSYDTELTGNSAVTVEYDGLTAEYEIQVHPVYIVGEILQDSVGYPESAHSYANYSNVTYPYTVEGAEYLKLTFSSSTLVESGYDRIYIYDGSDALLGNYTGSSLAGQTVTVTGDTVKIKLTSDGSVVKYGFSLSSIYAYMEIVEHEPTDEGVYTDPLCYEDGYTTHVCWICGDSYVVADPGTATHVYADGFCTGCGIPENSVSSGQLTDTLLWALTEDNTLYISGTGAIPSNLSWDIPADTTLIIGEGVTAIGQQAFYGCVDLIAAELPESLTTVGEQAFYNCSGLVSVELSEGLASIGNYAFYGCSALAELKLPDSLTAIGSYAFYNCSTLTALEIPDAVTTISAYAFYNCSGLTSVTLPENLSSIENNAFQNCSSLTEILFPAALTNVGTYAFSGCSALASVTMNEGLTTLGNSIFYGCFALSELRLPSTITSVNYNGYRGPLDGSGITKVTFADGTASVPSYMLSNYTSGTSGTYSSKIVEIIFEDPADVTTIGSYAFYNCAALETFEIPDAITSISDYTFSGCVSLTEITLPAGLKSIGNYAFYGCSVLDSVTLPEGLTTLGCSIFYGCFALTELRLPSTITSVNYSSNRGPLDGSGITKVTFADGFTSVPSYILSNYASGTSGTYSSRIREVVFEDASKITSIGSYAFYNCAALESFEIPEAVTVINACTFSGCTSLKELVLPAGLKSIGYYAFQNCTALTGMTLPEGITTLGYSVFYGCSGLTELRLPATLTSFGYSGYRGPLDGSGITRVIFADGFTSVPAYALSNYTSSTSGTYASKIKEVVFEDASKITSIGAYAFQNCANLECFDIPENVTAIPNYAFYYCTSLAELTIPETVTSIGNYAFYSCTSLNEVNVAAGQSVGSYAYGYCTGLRTLTIGDGANIGSYAFRNCTNLSSITMGDNVTLGSDAFYGVTLSGSCGENMTYSLVLNTGVLTISGSGSMTDYTEESPAPWSGFASMVTEVSFGDTVTDIGDYAFIGCSNLEYMYLPETIKTLGKNCFAGCTNLTYVEIPDGVSFIGEEAFSNCDNLTEAVFLGDAPTMESNIFGSSPVEVFYPETASGFIARIFEKFIEYIWTKWDDTIPSKDVVILLDVSGSMSGKTGTLSSASTQLIQSICGSTKKTRISVVTYESSASTRASFSSNVHYLSKKVSSLSANGGTNYSSALNRAKSLLTESNADIKFVIMFSDGQPGDSTSTINSIASGMRDSGIVMYTVGLGTNSTQRQVLIDVAGSASRYFEASDIAGLIAAFEELSENFGKSEYSTIEMKINDTRVDLFNNSYTLCLAANETISFYVTLGTNEMYGNVASYALEQNGQYVIQNTTGDFTNLSTARYFTAGSPVYLVLLDASGNVIERKELMLTFVDSYTIRYLMGPDMGNAVYLETTFLPGSKITPPAEPSRSGFEFGGWYTSEKCEGVDFFTAQDLMGSQSLAGKITVYAKWDRQDTDLDLGIETWTFGNSPQNFACTHYEMTTNDVSRLKQDRTPSEQSRMDSWRFPTKYNEYGQLVHYWGGSCFGMSSSVLLSHFGDLSIYNFPQNGTSGTRYTTIGAASLTRNSNGDTDVGAIESMINFYQMRQGLGSINTIRSTYVAHTEGTDSTNLERIIRKLKNADAPVLMTITLIKPNGEFGGHAVVAYDLEEFADGYTFKVYDCSQFGTKDNPIFYTVDVNKNGDTYTASCPEWTNAWTGSGYNRIFFKTALTVAELKALPLLTAPNTLRSASAGSTEQVSTDYVLTTNYGSFAITDGTSSAVITDGMLSSGELEVTCCGMISEVDAENEYVFDLPVLTDGGSYTITQTSAEYCKTTLFCADMENGFYTSQIAPAAGIVTIGSDGSISTQYSGTVEQHLEVTRNNLTTPWYTVKISGESTGFTMTPNGDSITVASAEETTVDITTKSGFNNVTLTDVPVNEEESSVQESEGSCVVVQNNQIVAGEVYGYSVAFNSQMGTSVPTLTNVPYGSLIDEPTDPTKTGCIFEGWFIDEEYTELWDFSTDVVTEDTILYAGWSNNPNYLKTVTFRVPGYEDQIVYIPKGELIPVEYAPVDENGEVMVWHTRADFANDAWDFAYDVVTNDVVLYGKTTLCTVSYEPNNGTTVTAAKIYAGNLLTEPANVTRDSYTLCGWYTDTEFTEQWNFSTDRLAEDITLYAKWAENVIDKEGRDTGISIEIVNEADIVYTGKAVTPDVIVRDNGKILTVKTDYAISFKNNTTACDKDDSSVKENKLPQIIVQGKGNYKSAGKITRYFTIHQADMKDLQVTVPAVVTVKSGNKLQTLKPVVSTDLVKVSDKEFTTRYYTDEDLTQNVSGITETGIYYVVLEAAGINLQGVTEAFKVTATTADKLLSKAKINPPKTIFSTGAAISEDAAIQSLISSVVLNKVTYLTGDEDLAEFKALFTVTAVDTDGMEVAQSDLGQILNSVGKKTVTVTALEGNAEGLVGSASAKITVKGAALNKKQFHVSFGDRTAKELLKTDYTGSAQIPAVYSELEEGTDYTVTYLSGKTQIAAYQIRNAGTYSLVITGQGSYSGSLTYKFTINALNLATAYANGQITITSPGKTVYSASGATLSPTVSFQNSRQLAEGVDYTLKCSGNSNVTDKATIALTGKGNFKGSLSKLPELTYTIERKSLSSSDVSVTVTGITMKNGVVSKVNFSVCDGSKKLPAAQYTGSFVDDGEVITLTITGTEKNYTGTRTVQLSRDLIKASDKKQVITSLPEGSKYYYTGESITPEILITDAEGNDISQCFTITYGTNKYVGSGSITVSGRPDMGYYGSVTVKFTILPKWMKWLFG